MRRLLLAAAVVSMIAGSAMAADIARLEWGGFVVDQDSANGWTEYKSVSSDDGKSVTITFAPLDAKADGGTLEATASLAGHYDVIQPDFDSFTTCVVTVEGHVIKSDASTTRLEITIGGQQSVIEWPAGTQASEKFSRNVEVPLAANGRLPVPFVVGVKALAKKDGPSDAAYVSVDRLTIRAANAQVAGN